MQPQLPLAEYEFIYQAIDDIKIPPFPGKLFHGAFGNALYKNVCIAQAIEYKACMFKKQCAYTELFKSQHSPLTGSIQNNLAPKLQFGNVTGNSISRGCTMSRN